MMLLDNAGSNHQTNADALFLRVYHILGTIILIKDILLFFCRNTDSCIPYFNNPFVFSLSHYNTYGTFLCILQSIRKQIIHYMIHLALVQPYLRHLRFYLQIKFYLLFDCSHTESRQLIFHVRLYII